jgi:hypothetical protein
MSDDDDDTYSFDDDFANTSQDERFGLSSICEEPADLKSSSCSSIENFSRECDTSKDEDARYSSVYAGSSEHAEQKCDDSHDSYSVDDFASLSHCESNFYHGAAPKYPNSSASEPTDEDVDKEVCDSATTDIKPLGNSNDAKTPAAAECKAKFKRNNIVTDRSLQRTDESYGSYSVDDDFATLHDESYIGDVVNTAADHNTHENKSQVIMSDSKTEKGDQFQLIPNDEHCTPARTAEGLPDTAPNDIAPPKVENSWSVIDNQDRGNQTDTDTTEKRPTIDQHPLQKWHHGKRPEQMEECKEDPKSKAHTEDTRAGQAFHWDSKYDKRRRKTPAPLPRCATLQTKCMSGAMRQTESIEPKKPKHKYSTKRLQELAQPRKHNIYVRDENSNSQNPELKNQSKGAKSKKKSHSNHDFLDRMDSLERQRRDKAELAVGASFSDDLHYCLFLYLLTLIVDSPPSRAAQAAYDAKIDTDKLHCPKCGRIQSYIEMVSKSMICHSESCNKQKIHYKKTVRRTQDFFERQERSSQRRSIKIDEILSERRSSLLSQCLERSRQQQELMRKVSNNGQDFMTRMEKDISARHKKTSRLTDLIDESLRKAHTFKPILQIPEHLIRNRKGGISSLAVPARRYIQTFDERLEESERKQGKKRSTKSNSKRGPIESLWRQGPSTVQKREKEYDEAKTKKKFQHSYM